MRGRVVTAVSLLVAGLVGAGLLWLWSERDVLSVRLPTRVLAPPDERPTTPAAALEYFQCNRCHVLAQQSPVTAPLVENCVTCHQAIAAGRFDRWEPAERVASWKQHLVHLVRTPDLSTLPRRVRRAWLVDFLQRPHVVRPLAGAMMPRLPIGPAEAGLLADALGVIDDAARPSPAPEREARGAALYRARGCAECHYRGDAPEVRFGSPLVRDASEARRRAPDLRWVAARMSSAQLRAWLRSPRAVQPGTLMPELALTDEEVEDLAAFLVSPVPERARRAARTPRLLDRTVHADEVAQRLTGHLCLHCHSDAQRPGDRGPGHSGGLGYRGAGVDLATAASLRDAVLHPARGQAPARLLESLEARVREVDGVVDPAVLGMPLGLPPLPDEDLDLVATWLSQGAPP